MSSNLTNAETNASQRMERVLEYTGLNTVKLALRLGLRTPQGIYEIRKGNTKGISRRMVDSIHREFPEISTVWLSTGHGEMIVPQGNDAEQAPEQAAEQIKYSMVPIIHIDSVGGVYAPNDIITPEYVEKMVPLPGAQEGDVAIYQSGSSMEPNIPSGSLLHLREVREWRQYLGYGNVFVLLLSDWRRITKVVKRFDPDPLNYVLCVSYNPEHAPEELPKAIISRVWQVVNVLINKGW